MGHVPDAVEVHGLHAAQTIWSIFAYACVCLMCKVIQCRYDVVYSLFEAAYSFRLREFEMEDHSEPDILRLYTSKVRLTI